MTKQEQKEQTFEQAYQQLESIVEILEKGESTLEESMKVFEEGMRLVQFCTQKLDDAQGKLQTLVKEEDGSFQLKEME